MRENFSRRGVQEEIEYLKIVFNLVWKLSSASVLS